MFLHTPETLQLFHKNPQALCSVETNMKKIHDVTVRLYELKNYNEKQFVAAVHMYFPDVCVFKWIEYWRGEFISEKLNEMALAVYNLL
jgi:hypothetical protein